MIWTLIPVLAMVVIVIVLRKAAWWGQGLVSRLLSKVVKVLGQIQARDDISGLGSRIRATLPGTAHLLRAQLAPNRYTGLPLTLILIAAL